MPEMDIYEPLPGRHIRLIRLHPGTDDEPLFVSLVAAALDGIPDFEALSYVWGDPTDTRSIICNDVAVGVTQNLFAALSQFRRPDATRTLWADALCINQRDLDERAQQVQIMHLIYKSCARCLVWLGPDDEHSGIALEIIHDMTGLVSKRLSIPEDQLDAHLKKAGRDPRLTIDVGFDSLPPLDSTKWGSLFHFLCRPWFSRVWVMQEAYFSDKVLFHCGPSTLSYASLYHTADWVLNNGNALSYEANQAMADYMSTSRFNIMSMRASDWQRSNQDLKVLLNDIKKFDATDLRDKVYALIHFPPFRREYPDIQVDYRQSYRDVYADVAKRIILHEKGLGLLTMVDRLTDNPTEDGFPSWVPRWQRADDTPNVSSMWYQFFSAGTTDGVPTFPVDPFSNDALSVPGFELDVIEDVCRIEFRGTHRMRPPLQPVFHVDEPWKPYERSPDSPYPIEPDIIAAYAMTFTASCRGVGGFWARRCPEDEQSHHQGDFVGWLQWLRTAGEVEDGQGSHYPPGLYSQERPFLNDTTNEEMLLFATRYHVAVRMYNLQRRLFRTKKGYLGLGAHGLVKGDQICILAGGALPIILRSRQTGGHELIGDAYVHGVMDGEAARSHMAQQGLWSTYHIH